MRAIRLPLLLAAFAAAVLPPPVSGAPRKGKVVGGPNEPVRPEDVPYIKCQVCQLLAKNAWLQVKELKKNATAAKPLAEHQVIECMEKITTAWRPEGEWIAKLDLVEEGSKLVLKEMDVVGNCGSECKTVQLAANRIVGEHDTDMAEILFTGKLNRVQFNRWLCWDESQACREDPPPVPKDREPGPPFDPRKEGDHNIEAMMEGLADQGLSTNKKLREELMIKLGAKQPDENSVDAALQRAMAQAQAQAAEAAASSEQGGWEEL